jgi:excisionase family DNA binding protein
MFLPIPDDVIEALARRVAEIVLTEMADDLRPSQGRWLRAKEAAECLGLTRSALYSRVHSQAIPHYKVEGILLFKRDELDRWIEDQRVEPRGASRYPEPVERRRRATASPTPHTTRGSTPQLGEKGERPAPKKRERPLPPPLGGTDEQKESWARDLEITRAELDDMSPPEFDKARKARNKRLEAAGVFDQLTELEEAYGEGLWSMTTSELIEAVGKLRESASAD